MTIYTTHTFLNSKSLPTILILLNLNFLWLDGSSVKYISMKHYPWMLNNYFYKSPLKNYLFKPPFQSDHYGKIFPPLMLKPVPILHDDQPHWPMLLYCPIEISCETQSCRMVQTKWKVCRSIFLQKTIATPYLNASSSSSSSLLLVSDIMVCAFRWYKEIFFWKFRIESKCANIIVNPKSAALVSHGVKHDVTSVEVGCVRPKSKND